MSLSFPVKINQITNLSDARYCAGMGVEMAGFQITTGEGEELNKIQAIINWITGVKIVGEFNQLTISKAEDLVEKLGLDMIEIDYFDELIIPISLRPTTILKFNSNEFSFEMLDDLLNKYNHVSYFHINNQSLSNDDWAKLCSNYSIIYGNQLSKNELPYIIEQIKPLAISLNGGNELAPGLKDFEELASILESLEEDY